MSIKVLEAFAGIGAQRKVLTNIGLDYESVGIIEIDKPAENSYNLLHGQTKNFGDITKVDEKELPDFDLFTSLKTIVLLSAFQILFSFKKEDNNER